MFSSHSMAQHWDWAVTIPDSNTGFDGWRIRSLSGNGFAFGGFGNGDTMTFGSVRFYNPRRYLQMVVGKITSSGAFVWATRSDSSDVYLLDLCTDKKDNTYVLGYFDSTNCNIGGVHLTGTPHYSTYFITKFAASGSVVWAKTLYTRMSAFVGDISGGICLDPNGNIFISSPYRDINTTIGTDTLPYYGCNSVFLGKFDQYANLLWARGFGGISIVNDVVLDSRNNISIAGYFDANFMHIDSFTLTNTVISSLGHASFLAKFDSFGHTFFAKSFVGASEINALGLDRYDNLYCVGGFKSTISYLADTLNLIGIQNSFLMKFSTAGNLLWSKSGKGVANNAYDICIDSCNNIFLTGCYGYPTSAHDSINFDGSYFMVPDSAVDPMYLCQYDDSGHLIDLVSQDSGGDDVCSIQVDNLGHVYLCGDYVCLGSYIILANDTFYHDLSEKLFISKYTYDSLPCIPFTHHPSIVETFNAPDGPVIYPSPANTTLYMESGNDGAILEILSVFGTQVVRMQLHAGKNSIEVGDIPPGVYLCKINNNGERVTTKRIVIQH